MIHRVRINRLLPDGSPEEILTFRIGGTQDQAEGCGEALRTRWMHANPGVPTTMVVDWPRPDELGGHFTHPARSDLVRLPLSLTAN